VSYSIYRRSFCPLRFFGIPSTIPQTSVASLVFFQPPAAAFSFPCDTLDSAYHLAGETEKTENKTLLDNPYQPSGWRGWLASILIFWLA